MQGAIEHRETAGMSHADPAGIKPGKIAIGLAVSLLLHGMLIFWARHHVLFGMRAPVAEQRFAMEVRIAPPAAPPVVQAAPALPKTAQPPPQTATTVAARKITPPSPNASPSVSQATPATPPVETAQPAEARTPINIETVRGNLGAVVAEVDRQQLDTPLGQVRLKPQFPTQPDNKVARTIEQTHRISCKESIDAWSGAGLLGPLFAAAQMALDKKDSGCKW